MSSPDAEYQEATLKSRFKSITKWYKDHNIGVYVALASIVGVLVLVGVAIKRFSGGWSGPYSYFGTSTPYDVVRGDISRPNRTICEPVQIWMLARHGTVYPRESEIIEILYLDKIRDRIIQNHRRGGGGTLEHSVLKKLSTWRLDPGMRTSLAEQPTAQGDEEMRRLAERLRMTFPELLNVTSRYVRNGDFIFRATSTPQTNASLRAFRRALFGNNDTFVSPAKPPESDTLLRAYKSCRSWEDRCHLDDCKGESKRFAKGSRVEEALNKFNQRLGFNRTLNHVLLDYHEMRTMYNLCRYETAIAAGSRSVWCDLFAKGELEILEYQEDLDYYYYSGPGNRWSTKLGCHPLKDMYARFRNIVDGTLTYSAKGVFYFTDAITLQTMMAALGTDGGSSKPLTAQTMSPNRKFRTSLLTPFATNIIAVLYRCNGSRYSVSFHTAEKLEQIDGCRDGLCDWPFIERRFGSDVRTCSMDFC